MNKVSRFPYMNMLQHYHTEFLDGKVSCIVGFDNEHSPTDIRTYTEIGNEEVCLVELFKTLLLSDVDSEAIALPDVNKSEWSFSNPESPVLLEE